MQLQANNRYPEITEKNIATVLKELFPEFESSLDWSEGNYEILGDLAIQIRDGIRSATIKDNTLEKTYGLLNKMAKTEDKEVANLLVVGVMEILTDFEEVVSKIKAGLDTEALEIFDKVLNGWSE